MEDGKVVGVGSTVQEIDHFSEMFDKIYHCAPLLNGTPNPSFLEYKSKNVDFVPLKLAGGINLASKLKHLLYYFTNLKYSSCVSLNERRNSTMPGKDDHS